MTTAIDQSYTAPERPQGRPGVAKYERGWRKRKRMNDNDKASEPTAVRINATIPVEIWDAVRQLANAAGLEHAKDVVVLRWALEQFSRAKPAGRIEPCTN